MNYELKKLNNWFNANKLCLNVKKTKAILFSPQSVKNREHNGLIYLNGQAVDQIRNTSNEQSFKFLGIHIDENLSWKYHIQKVCKKITSANYIINKVKNLIPSSTLKTLYSSLVHSHINYGLQIWGRSKYIDKVIKSQKKAIRIIHSKPFNYHTEPLFKFSRILKVQDQYTVNVLIFMHKLKYHKLPASFNTLEYFKYREQPFTRQTKLANCPRARTIYTSLLPLHQFPRTWNELGLDFHDILTVWRLKRQVKYSILTAYDNFVHCNNARCRQCFPPV